ncbi:probable cyclic nucleotide-gated ion channel 20, chloroplastic [Alnus glutinosa]|uniref:probable cyclic nucleotide-gated ion channel 20, chloroplastic n=1 Tax=Alnus glutinosa TaxID=3517 RepID=UPI002D76A033|nr:probable cyclic nucleotide-gated ion channel 20, chloroplastic [Alnus glutinosa]
MAGFEKDDIPMLSDTNGQSSHEHVDSQFQKLAYRTRSASISIPMNSVESYESETILVGHTGPLRSERRTPFTQMSGPLYVGRKPENLIRPNQAIAGCKTVEPLKGNFPSSNGKDPVDWPHDIYTGKNEHLLRSGQLGMCNDPYCTTCPIYYDNFKAAQQKNSKGSSVFDTKFHSALYGDAKGWARRFYSFLQQYIPGVMNPHAKVVQQWNKFFVISCLVAIFVDPLFFFLLSTLKDNKCIVIDSAMTKTIVVFRSLTDLIYFFYMLLQFRLAFVAPDSTVFGAGELVDDPKKIALNYIRGFFFVDLFVVLPLPQIIILFVLPPSLGSTGANYAKNLLRLAVLVQYIPRLYRFLPLLTGQSPIGFVFESAWTNFVINLLTFMLAGHVVGSCWYLFGLQRVNQCLRDACDDTRNNSCMKFIDCGYGDDFSDFLSNENWSNWKINQNASACFTGDGFSYGIYIQAVNLTTERSIITRYTYSLFWGFQQISTLAGNQVPSYFVWEVLFTMAIIGLGLLLFALLIGHMQNFLQALGRRRLEMSLRRRDVEQWMSHRRLSEKLRRQVRQAERYNWAATRGVNEEVLLENLPEDLQRDIRRHLFKFVKKVRIFALMDEPVLDAICERLRQKIYIKGSKILYQGGLIDKMVFIVRGKAESMGEDGNVVTLSEGDVCGEELLSWCLEHSSVNKDERKRRIPGQRLLSSRTVSCLTNVEAFSLRAADLEEVTSLYSRFLRNTRVQGAIRYESPYWRSRAAILIQVAWRYRRKHLNRTDTSQSSHSSSTAHQGTSLMVPFLIDYGHHMKL